MKFGVKLKYMQFSETGSQKSWHYASHVLNCVIFNNDVKDMYLFKSVIRGSERYWNYGVDDWSYQQQILCSLILLPPPFSPPPFPTTLFLLNNFTDFLTQWKLWETVITPLKLHKAFNNSRPYNKFLWLIGWSASVVWTMSRSSLTISDFCSARTTKISQ